MPRHRITKTIDFCYGHRLLEYDGKCKQLHGHNGLLEVDLESDTLDRLGMVRDFTEVRDIVKGWVDEHLDHKMLLRRDDPVIPALKELGEPLVLFDVNPTAENIAKHIFEQARENGLPLTEVRLWETSSSYAVYRED